MNSWCKNIHSAVNIWTMKTTDNVQVLFFVYYHSFCNVINNHIIHSYAYTRVVCVSMHVLFPIRRFVLCAIAFALGKLRVVLKIADQSRASSHFNSQNTHSQFRNSQLAFYPCPWFSDRKGIRPVKNWMLVCRWWWFDWSFAWLIAPVVQLSPPPPPSQ